MSEIWRFTGNPENWLTAVSISKWALNEHNRGLWERSIRPGDIALFHATAKSDFAAGGSSTVIGFGYVGQPLATKTDFWWVQEVRDKENLMVKKVVRRAERLKGHYHGFRFQACS